MAWKQQGVVAARPSVARRLWRVVRAVLYMLRRGVPSGRKLAMDLHLLLHRGKIAGGKALGDLLAVHHGRRRHAAFSSSAAANGGLHYHNYDAADVARVFEMLSDGLFRDDEPAAATTAACAATPSPARMLWALARSPAAVAAVPAASSSMKKLRVTDSPFQPAAAVDADDVQVDRQAEEFIRRFYEQLSAQRSAASTPDCYGYAPSPYAAKRVAAGVA